VHFARHSHRESGVLCTYKGTLVRDKSFYLYFYETLCQYSAMYLYPKAGLAKLFLESVPKLLIIFRETLSSANGNFEQQNGVLESCIIITNY
jgi:hypothetical protein